MHTISESVSTPRAEGSAKTARLVLVVAVLGVVFGLRRHQPDLHRSGTLQSRRLAPGAYQRADRVGSVSLIFWSVMIIVTLTYVTLVMRADNNGECGFAR